MENERIGKEWNFYEKVKAIVNKYEGTELKKKFKEVVGKTNEKGYTSRAVLWLSLALNRGEQKDLVKRFSEVFLEDFESLDPLLNTLMALRLKGIEDIQYTSPFSWVSEIYERSKLNIPLLIVGETGTSKEFLAKAIHEMSNRRKGPFVELNCAGIPGSILESELFGVVARYPGFHNSQALVGKFELANGGTLFLDEIGRMPKQLQVKILKAIDDNSFYPLGSSRIVTVDVRLIAATQPKYIKEKGVIPDLFWRLGGSDWIQMSTLNERINSFPLSDVLVIDNSKERVLEKMGLRKKSITISESAYDKLRMHEYRGNYRELESILTAAIIKAKLQERDNILPEDLEETMFKSKKYSEGEMPLKSEDESDLRHIKLKDLFSHADKIRASIIETKIKSEMQRTGLKLKPLCEREGIEYYSFRKKALNIIQKNLREFGVQN
jgi:transcriptional regulator with PAS, ATPase and Fis domain